MPLSLTKRQTIKIKKNWWNSTSGRITSDTHRRPRGGGGQKALRSIWESISIFTFAQFITKFLY